MVCRVLFLSLTLAGQWRELHFIGIDDRLERYLIGTNEKYAVVMSLIQQNGQVGVV